ncbi:nuclear transport factor 2 family protein [Nocardioides sp. Bht2]|uniref:nuclear transport factor 2 family protein n=1 Tax=Nocardioides sp. Bht2 TaxID=3392297 RepID=UPI0039B54CC7
MDDELASRLARLEAVAEITALKHRYLRACDAKRPDEFRACFVAEGAVLDYGPLGAFTGVEPIAAIYERVALRQVEGRYVIFDMHHAVHPDITVLDADNARGDWTLRFRQVNTEAGTEQVSAIEYHDTYRRENGSWRIASSKVHVLWSMTTPLPAGFKVQESFR